MSWGILTTKEEFEKYAGVFTRPSDSEMLKLRKDAKVAVETAQAVLDDAEKEKNAINDSQSKFLVDIEKTRVLVGPENGVPIAEIQIKNTRPQKKSE